MDYGMDMDLVLNPPGPIDHGSLPCDPYYIDPNQRNLNAGHEPPSSLV